MFFFFHEVVERGLHPLEHAIDVAVGTLYLEVLFPVDEVINFEFVKQLLTPFRQDTQDRWAVDLKNLILDVLFSEGRYVFADFTPDQVASVACHFLPIGGIGSVF